MLLHVSIIHFVLLTHYTGVSICLTFKIYSSVDRFRGNFIRGYYNKGYKCYHIGLFIVICFYFSWVDT